MKGSLAAFYKDSDGSIPCTCQTQIAKENSDRDNQSANGKIKGNIVLHCT